MQAASQGESYHGKKLVVGMSVGRRAGGKHGNKGVECAVATLKMLELKYDLEK